MNKTVAPRLAHCYAYVVVGDVWDVFRGVSLRRSARRKLAVPRRSPPRDRAGYVRRGLSVGGPQEGVRWARAGSGFSLFAKFVEVAGDPESD